MTGLSNRFSGKVVDLPTAVNRLVGSGDTVFVGGFGHAVPFAAAHEVLRQQIGDLTLCRSGADILFDQMIAAGAVKKVIFGYLGNPGIGLAHAFRRAVEAGSIEVEEWTNFAMILRLHASRLGVPFLPAQILQIGDIPSGARSLREVICPHTGQALTALPALAPDVALIHAQQCDAAGNVQFWGIDGDTVEGALASRQILVTVERLVAPEVIAAAPERTRLPAHRVGAIAVVPWGAHPSYVSGFYSRDDAHFSDYDRLSREAADLMAYLERWVYGPRDRDAYLGLIGSDKMEDLACGLGGRESA